ncbi:MAG: hypothetical protein GY852_10800, partial [bacterium]|nr:hypothetical protein [bacterium]
MMKILARLSLFLAFVGCSFFFSSSSSFSQEYHAWTDLGLHGGKIYDIAIDPGNPDRMFAGSHLGDGLFITTNAGSSWQTVRGSE